MATSEILVNTRIRSAKPQKKPYELSDGKCAGLRLRVMPAGRKSWWYVYRERRREIGKQGRVRRISLGEYPTVSLSDARSKRDHWASMRSDSMQAEPHEYLERTAREERERAELHEFEAIRGDWTVRCLGDTFVDHLRRTTKERTWREVARQLEHDVYPVLGEIPADAVTSDDVRRVLRPIEKRGHLRQRNAVRTTLRWLYRWATDPDRHGPRHLHGRPNPVLETSPIREGRRTESGNRPVQESELAGLWQDLLGRRGELYADVLALQLLCGTRISETVNLQARDVDLGSGVWRITGDRTKNGRDHEIVLPRQARSLLEARIAKRGYIFRLPRSRLGHARVDSANKYLVALMKARDHDTRRIGTHSLRKTLLTTVVGRLGYRQEVRRRMANHVSGDALELIYVKHDWTTDAAEAWQRWADYLDSLLASRSHFR